MLWEKDKPSEEGSPCWICFCENLGSLGVGGVLQSGGERGGGGGRRERERKRMNEFTTTRRDMLMEFRQEKGISGGIRAQTQLRGILRRLGVPRWGSQFGQFPEPTLAWRQHCHLPARIPKGFKKAASVDLQPLDIHRLALCKTFRTFTGSWGTRRDPKCELPASSVS